MGQRSTNKLPSTQNNPSLNETLKTPDSSNNVINDLLELKIAIPLIIGIVIRLLLAPYTEQRWDMFLWRLYPALVYGYQKNPFWTQHGVPRFFSWGYPPLWLFACLLFYKLYAFFWPVQYPIEISSLWERWNITGAIYESYRSFIPNELPYLDVSLKIPVIAADVLIGILLYLMIKSLSNKKKARHSFYIWIFNPLVIFISSVWGMFDLIPALFVLGSLYCLTANKYNVSAVLLSIAICFKLYPIILIPLFTLIIDKQSEKTREAGKYLLISGSCTFIIMFLTYFVVAFLSGQDAMGLSIHLMKNLIFKRASPDFQGKNDINGLTPLVLLNPVLDKMDLNFNVPISPVLMGGALICILLMLNRRRKLSITDIISYTIVTIFMIYLTYSTIHVPHFTWVLPFLLLFSSQKNEETSNFQYWALTILGIYSILVKYDLSYFISPYFLWKELDVHFPAIFARDHYSLEFIICFTLLYINGIILAMKRSKEMSSV